MPTRMIYTQPSGWLLAGLDPIQEAGSTSSPEDCLALYDLSSSYFEGSHCPVAELGYSRDGKTWTLWRSTMDYSLTTEGCPVADFCS
ncbi:MAG: hypothetical protein IPH35_13755 [Rhodoferax sp.]|nr:hypothetical protein [Rhodoferax sp.]